MGGRLQPGSSALSPWLRNPGGVRRRTQLAVAGFNRAHAGVLPQNVTGIS